MNYCKMAHVTEIPKSEKADYYVKFSPNKIPGLTYSVLLNFDRL